VTVLPGPSAQLPPGWPILNAEPMSAPQRGSAALQQSTAVSVPSTVPPTRRVESAGGTATAGSMNRGLAEADTGEDSRVEDALRALLTDEDRVGQLMIVGWVGVTAEDARAALRELHPGGIVYVDNAHTVAQASAINTALSSMAREYGLLPPLIAVDHEGGSVQRIGDVPNLGTNLEFGNRRPSDQEACERGQRHSQQLRSMGFNMNLEPVLDVNNNPANPVIGNRSYGDDPELVARLGSAYARGMQAGGVVAVCKHFPGHGNTAVDSHLELPILPQTLNQLEQVELVPFRRAITADTDIAAIMSAHIVFPSVDGSGSPATLSRPIMTGLLRERLGFQGLVVSDDLAGMKAITDNFSTGRAAVLAVQAGVDMLIIGGGIPRQRQSRDALVAAVRSGELNQGRIDEAVRHVLAVKARFGLLGGPTSAQVACP
jgi:beta-N-acetylhexosaminidase